MTLYAGNSLTGAIYKGDQLICSSSGGGGGSGTRDVELTRISDDSGNEIGTWYMNFVDANNNEFKVICLDAQYRLASCQFCSNTVTITGLPQYTACYIWWYEAKETATSNTQKILDFCTANNYTSSSSTHCRSQSFTIDGIVYYGQLPNLREVFDMWRHRIDITTMDITTSSYTSVTLNTYRNLWSSTQSSKANAWYMYRDGNFSGTNKTSNCVACPVLEIPV